ncbi:MAG: hypothetical protein AAGG08_08205, partial [Actinomycetota bacterium]
EVAPTVVYDNTGRGADWREEYDFLGDAMNVAEEVARLIDDGDRRLGELDAAIGDVLDGQTVSVARARPGDGLQLRLAGSSIGIILDEVGIERPPSQQAFTNDDGFFTLELSQELWPDQVDADYVFLYSNQPPGAANDALLASIQEKPLWLQLESVQNDRAIVVDAHWHAAGPIAEHKIIDDLYRIFVGTEPTSPNPISAPG